MHPIHPEEGLARLTAWLVRALVSKGGRPKPYSVHQFVGLGASVHYVSSRSRVCRSAKIRRIKIIFAGNTDEREQGIAASVGERCTHALRVCSFFRHGTDWPVRGDPLTGGMGEHGGQTDDAGRLIDRRGLHRCDLMLAERLAHDIEAVGERGIAEAPLPLPCSPGGIMAVSDFSGLTSSACALANAAASAATDHWTGAWAASVSRTTKLTAPDLERLPRTPCPMHSLASSGIKDLSSLFARSWSRNAWRVLRNKPANSAHEFEELMSTSANGFDTSSRRLSIDQVGRFAGLDTTPEFFFSRNQNAEIEWVHGNRDLNPFAAAGNDGEH